VWHNTVWKFDTIHSKSYRRHGRVSSQLEMYNNFNDFIFWTCRWRHLAGVYVHQQWNIFGYSGDELISDVLPEYSWDYHRASVRSRSCFLNTKQYSCSYFARVQHVVRYKSKQGKLVLASGLVSSRALNFFAGIYRTNGGCLWLWHVFSCSCSIIGPDPKS